MTLAGRDPVARAARAFGRAALMPRDFLRTSAVAATVSTVAAVALAVAACSSGGAASSGSAKTPTTAPSTAARPAGPAADLSHPLTGGKGVFIGEPRTVDLKAAGYVQDEYLAAGTASSYSSASALTADGRWTLTPGTTAAYRTRVLVRRPAKASAFSGNVVIEWLNVSGGLDADPEWISLNEEIIRRGDAWVGVSAQQVGVLGGPVLTRVGGPGSDAAGKGLRKIDPARYGSLVHPGDAYSFDMFTQIARALRSGAALGGLRPQRLIAAGESQSAFAMVTYYNGVQPLTHAFDAFFVHSRGASGLPLVTPGKSADLANSLGRVPSIFRTDQDAPVLDIQSESDVTSILSSYQAHQPDSARFRLWEVAGTSHADVHLIGPNYTTFDCGLPINNGPMHLVAKAALRALTTWLTTGTPPPSAPRLTLTSGGSPQNVRNADGIALGGIRTPPVDVPVAALSGAPGPKPSPICLLSGSTKAFSAARLAQLYPTRQAYLKAYNADADKTIRAGYVLPEDRAALLAFADPSAIATG